MGTSRAIGVLVADTGNPFYADLIRGIDAAAARHGLYVLLSNSNNSPDRGAEYVNFMHAQRSRGLIFAPSSEHLPDAVASASHEMAIVLGESRTDLSYAMPERLRLGVLLGGVLGLRSGEVRALQRRDFSLGGNMPTVTVARAVKEAEGKVEIGALKTARKGTSSRTLPIPAALLDAVRAHLRDHTQIGHFGLLFWRASDGDPIRSAAWLKIFKKACGQVASDLEAEAVKLTAATGEPESDESQRVRELLADQGGYIFHGTRVTGLTWSYRLSGGNLKAVQAIGGHTSSKTALRYQRADVDYLAAIAANVSGMIESGDIS